MSEDERELPVVPRTSHCGAGEPRVGGRAPAGPEVGAPDGEGGAGRAGRVQAADDRTEQGTGEGAVRAAPPHPRAMDRRTMIKLMAAAAAAPAVVGCEPGDDAAVDVPPGASPPGATNPLAAGTPWDPDLIAPTVPWEGVLTDDELETLAVLCDVVIPADERSPSASAVGAPAFIDEYVSAPYASMERDRILVRGGLVWLDAESERRFGEGSRFRTLTGEQRTAICDDICSTETAEPPFVAAARFFDTVRDLTATAFYTTPEGMEDVGYVGNRPILGPWPAPPPEALRHLGLEE